MGAPDNSPPPRPKTVPVEARWDPKEKGFEWVAGALDGEGRRHGTYRSWTREGLLHGQCSYDHGKVHGKNVNFHPDGTIASEADWVNGLILDTVFFRSDAPSPEPFAQAGANVWSVRYYTRDGKTNFTIRYFLRDGSECGPDGKPLPPRPANVSRDARWFPEMDRWVDGEIERGTNRQVGHWRWWSNGGVLRHEERRDAQGEAMLASSYEADGTLEKKTTRTDAGEEREYFFDDAVVSTRYRTDANRREIYKGSWARDGSLEDETVRIYDPDGLASVTERGAGGALAFEARREGPAMACVLYREDGKIHAVTGLLQDGRLAGTWRLFDEAGAVRRETDLTPAAVKHGVTGHDLTWSLGHALYKLDEPSFETPAQLAGIDGEPWAETAGCHADHVEEFPRLVRGLVASDPLVRRYALGAIEREIEHQGSTYPATARVIPYLASVLAHPNADRARLLALLHCVGDAALPYVDEVTDADDDTRLAIQGTVAAIAAAWPKIFALFATASPEDRRRILTLAKFAPDARANVTEVARHDRDAGMRACAVESLTSQDGYDLADVLPSLSDRDLLVRAATAIAIGCTKGPRAPREAVHALDEAIRGWREIATRFADLPYTDGHVLAYAALATGSIRTPDARSLAQALCAPIDEVDGRSAITYGQGLLALAFGSGERPFAKRFVEILDTLAHSKQFWLFDVNAHEILEKWHLPRDRAALAALVAELERVSDPEAVMHAKMQAKLRAAG